MSDPVNPPGDDIGFTVPPAATGSRIGVGLVLALVVAGGVAFGYLRHRDARGDVALPIAPTAPSRVEVIKATLLASDHALVLPGVIRPREETKLYPRVTGYVRRWLVDIGDKVTEGQTLAEIDAPELDAQLAQARAQLAQAQAQVKQATAQRNYSKSTTARFETLSDQKLISKSQVEQTQAQAATDEANVAAAQSSVASQVANVRRLGELAGFTKVIAPFAGTITTRTIDRGSLVSEGNSTPMFTVVATDVVRIFVDAPQSVATTIRSGSDAAITVREYAARAFPGKVTRASGSLDPSLHTMTTEIQVPNADGALLPGMYVQVAITLPVPHRVFEVPSTAVYNDARGVRLATIDAAQTVHFVPIVIERDTGGTIQIASGLTGDERIIKISVPSLLDGDHVELAK